MKLEEFSQDNFEQASKRLIRSLTRGKTTSSHPKAIFARWTEWCGENNDSSY